MQAGFRARTILAHGDGLLSWSPDRPGATHKGRARSDTQPEGLGDVELSQALRPFEISDGAGNPQRSVHRACGQAVAPDAIVEEPDPGGRQAADGHDLPRTHEGVHDEGICETGGLSLSGSQDLFEDPD